jgi:hypothetical protein
VGQDAATKSLLVSYVRGLLTFQERSGLFETANDGKGETSSLTEHQVVVGHLKGDS